MVHRAFVVHVPELRTVVLVSRDTDRLVRLLGVVDRMEWLRRGLAE